MNPRPTECARRLSAWVMLAAMLISPLAIAQGRQGEALDPQMVLQGMRSALFTTRPQTGRMTITVRTAENVDAEWHADYLQQRRPDGGYTLIAMRDPPAVAGVVLLGKSTPDESRGWVYAPSVRRTRELDMLESDTRFLFSDITYGDLGMFERRASEIKVSLAPSEEGVPETYVVERVPADNWQVSLIRTWLVRETTLPLRKQFYDRAGRLWKEATYTHGMVEDVPTILEFTMRDVQAGGVTTVQRSDITYVDKVDEMLFDHDKLWRISEGDAWVGTTP